MSNYRIGDNVSVYIFAPKNWKEIVDKQELDKIPAHDRGRVLIKELGHTLLIGMPVDVKWGRNNLKQVEERNIKIIKIEGEDDKKKYRVKKLANMTYGQPYTYGLDHSSAFPNQSRDFITENQIIGLMKVGKKSAGTAYTIPTYDSSALPLKSENLKLATELDHLRSNATDSKLSNIVNLSDDLLWAVEEDNAEFDESAYKKLIRDANNAIIVINEGKHKGIIDGNEPLVTDLEGRVSNINKVIDDIQQEILRLDSKIHEYNSKKSDTYIPDAIRESGEMSEYKTTKEKFLKQIERNDSAPKEHQQQINKLHDTLRNKEQGAKVPENERTHKSKLFGFGSGEYRESPEHNWKPIQKYTGGRKTRRKQKRKGKKSRKKTRRRKTRRKKNT